MKRAVLKLPFKLNIQPVSYKRYFRCNNCFLLLVYTIHLSLSTNLVDPPPMRTIHMKHPLARFNRFYCNWKGAKTENRILNYNFSIIFTPTKIVKFYLPRRV